MISKFIPILLFFFLLIPVVSGVEGTSRITVNLGGAIDNWGNGGYGRYLFYGGLVGDNLTFISTMQGSGTSQEKFTIKYKQGMEIKFPRITLQDVDATYDTITFDKIENPGYIQEDNGVPGFELPIMILSLIGIIVIIRLKRKHE